MIVLKALATAAAIACAAYGGYVTATWLRYGRAQRRRRAGDDSPLDRLMPDYDVCERHEIAIAAPPDVTFAAG